MELGMGGGWGWICGHSVALEANAEIGVNQALASQLGFRRFNVAFPGRAGLEVRSGGGVERGEGTEWHQLKPQEFSLPVLCAVRCVAVA
jgi:hypothetical protein